MDIGRVNYVLERAILHFQSEEIEALWERFKVPSPQAMAKKHGMALTVSADDAMKRVDSAMSTLTSGHGKLTDPNRTPSRKELVDALNELIEVSKGMAPKDRKEVLAQLRDWQKLAREHAKRLQQAAYSHRVGDVGRGDLGPARNVRDDLTDAIAVVVKYKGGGFMKKATKTAAALAKDKAEAEREAERQAELATMRAKYQKIAQDNQEYVLKGTKRSVPDLTVGTFVKILEGYLWKAVRDSKGGWGSVSKKDFWKELMTVKRGAKSDWRSDEKRDLKDLLKHVKKVFKLQGGYSSSGQRSDLYDNLMEFTRMLEEAIRTGKFPHVPNEIKVQLRKPDKRQMAMKFEALKRLRLALVG